LHQISTFLLCWNTKSSLVIFSEGDEILFFLFGAAVTIPLVGVNMRETDCLDQGNIQRAQPQRISAAKVGTAQKDEEKHPFLQREDGNVL